LIVLHQVGIHSVIYTHQCRGISDIDIWQGGTYSKHTKIA